MFAGWSDNFLVLANSMRVSSSGMQYAATEVQRMSILPVINVSAQLNRVVRKVGNLCADIDRVSLTRNHPLIAEMIRQFRTFCTGP